MIGLSELTCSEWPLLESSGDEADGEETAVGIRGSCRVRKWQPIADDESRGRKRRRMPLRRVRRPRVDIMAESVGLPTCIFLRMVLIKLPGWFFSVLTYVLAKGYDVEPQFNCVEFYSGKATIYRAFIRGGEPAMAYDYINCPTSQNFLTTLGFLNAICCVCRLRPRGLNFWATVCSTWVALCRNSTYRTAWRPLGNRKSKCVVEANLQVARMAFLIRMSAAKYGRFCLEQPASSLMKESPRMRDLQCEEEYLMNGPWTEAQTYMAGFGKSCAKPTALYASGEWVNGLIRCVPENYRASMATAAVTVNKSGRKIFTGDAKNLKESQGYTPEFGLCVYREFKKSQRTAEEFDFFDENPDGNDDVVITNDLWEDVEGEQLCAHLGIRYGSPW